MSYITIDSSENCAATNSPASEPKDEPPSRSRSSIFLLGQDSCGHWVVQDKAGTRGGLFVDRAEALRYIRFEGGNRAFVTLTNALELDLARPSRGQFEFNPQRSRLVA